MMQHQVELSLGLHQLSGQTQLFQQEQQLQISRMYIHSSLMMQAQPGGVISPYITLVDF